jgi:glycosyltransferase involved in cell wall biosynthesis
MYHGDPLMKRVTEIIDRLVEAGIYNYWISLRIYMYKLGSRKIAIANPLEGYYSFNLYHMQPAFYLSLMGWCLSAICFIVELFCNGVLNKRM